MRFGSAGDRDGVEKAFSEDDPASGDEGEGRRFSSEKSGDALKYMR